MVFPKVFPDYLAKVYIAKSVVFQSVWKGLGISDELIYEMVEQTWKLGFWFTII
jgi:hypothetical protein